MLRILFKRGKKWRIWRFNKSTAFLSNFNQIESWICTKYKFSGSFFLAPKFSIKLFFNLVSAPTFLHNSFQTLFLNDLNHKSYCSHSEFNLIQLLSLRGKFIFDVLLEISLDIGLVLRVKKMSFCWFYRSHFPNLAEESK